MKTGVIDVGGGLRGIYVVGIFDYCMDHNIHFDLGIGISVGSAKICSTGQSSYPITGRYLWC